jgi:signal transduction histidine kinase
MFDVVEVAGLVGGVSALGAALAWRRYTRALRAVRRMLRAAQDSQAVLTRRLRLTAHDVRGLGMTLHGHADHLAAEAHSDTPGIATCAADLLDMADSLHDLAMDPAAPRVLRVESLILGETVDEAIAAVGNTILPGRRNWRVQPDLRPIALSGDRRAVRHALIRVLTDAVRNTRHDDWIDVGGEHLAGGFALVVADEGNGSLTPEQRTKPQDSRGIGLRLALARALMEAHGGSMEVESFAGVGSRVSLVFPAARLEGPGLSPPSHSCGAPARAAGAAGR